MSSMNLTIEDLLKREHRFYHNKEMAVMEFSGVGSAAETVGEDGRVGTKKYLGVYLSAHWCPPCRVFTPKLATLYNTLQDLEIVFASCDGDKADADAYFASMPWLAPEYKERFAEDIHSLFNPNVVPMLIVFEQGNTVPVTVNGYSDINTYLETGSERPTWLC